MSVGVTFLPGSVLVGLGLPRNHGQRERGGMNTGQWLEWDSEGDHGVGSCQGGEEAALRDEEDQEKEQVGDMGASRYPTVRKFTSF